MRAQTGRSLSFKSSQPVCCTTENTNPAWVILIAYSSWAETVSLLSNFSHIAMSGRWTVLRQVFTRLELHVTIAEMPRIRIRPQCRLQVFPHLLPQGPSLSILFGTVPSIWTFLLRYLDNYDFECPKARQHLENRRHHFNIHRAVQVDFYAALFPRNLGKGKHS